MKTWGVLKSSWWGPKINYARAKLSFGNGARAKFYSMLANMTEDGMPLNTSIGAIQSYWESQKDQRKLITADMLAYMRGDQRKAKTLGGTLDGWAPSLEGMMIDAGMNSSDISSGFRMAAYLARVADRIRAAVAKELVYPAVLLGMLFFLLILMKVKIFPVMVEVAPMATWPASAYYLGMLAERSIWVVSLLIGVVVAIITAFYMTRANWTGMARDRIDLFFPPWSIYRLVAGSMFLTTISQLLNSGIPIKEAVNQLVEVGTNWDKHHLSQILYRLRKGQSEGDSLAIPLYDPEARWEITVYGKMTKFAEGLAALSERQVENVIEKTGRQMSYVRAALMLMVGGTIVWIYSSLFLVTQAARSSTGM